MSTTTRARRPHRANHGSHLTLVPPPPYDPADLTTVWAAHWAGDRSAREQLIVHFHRIVRAVAKRMHARLGRHNDLDDLVSAGVLGLIDAVDRAEPGIIGGFEAYAATRIRGAIIDEIRALDWAPRSVRAHARDIAAATRDLATALQREPTWHEVASHLGVDPRRLEQTLADVAALHLADLDDPLGDGLTMASTIKQPDADPADIVDRQLDLHLLATALSRLPDDRVKLVLALFYFERLPMREIGHALNVSESRVSQMHHQGLRALRRSLERATAA